MARFAPAIYDVIKKLIRRGDKKYVADFTAAAEGMMKRGALVLNVEKKTGALLPTLRSKETGRIVEQVRLKAEELPRDMTQPVIDIQMQAMMANIMDAIEAVAPLTSRLCASKTKRIGSPWRKALGSSFSRLCSLKTLDSER